MVTLMCGISGVATKDLQTPPLGLAERMANLLRHRGPDEDGSRRGDWADLAMRRLSIIDVEGGHQPIGNEDGSVWVVANGELYNYVELREDLVAKGHQFRTGSDIEVAVHLYEERGDAFVENLNGMFAIALLDTRRQRLLLARDRMGKKPLFVAETGSLLGFSSDIKPLLLLPGLRREIDEVALNELLQYGYVPQPRTMFRGIREVSAGGLLLLEGGKVQERKYWSLEGEVRDVPEVVTFEQALAQTRALFSDAVRLRMRSDVPVGVFLSGGVDSTLIAAEMVAQAEGPPIRSFSIGFPGSPYDETAQASEVAARLGTVHTHAPFEAGDALGLQRKVLWFLEEPHGDASFLPSYALASLASEDVKCVMTGDGGDEAYGGYERYLAAWRRCSELPPAKVVEETLALGVVFSAAGREALLAPEALRTVPPPALPSWMVPPTSPGGVVRALMVSDAAGLLTDNNVVKPDKMGMACSVEARSPFLDYRMVVHGLNLPGELHVAGGRTKAILRAMVGDAVPAVVAARPKQQFTVPVGEWIRTDAQGRYSELLGRLSRRQWIRSGAVLGMLADHQAGKANHTRQLRLLVALEIWLEEFIDRDPTLTPGVEG
jgi:asparagine synthase (glutamine-hydrolysing)